MMYTSSAQVLFGATLLATANAHGYFAASMNPRMPGQAMSAACGQQVYSNQKSDNYGNVQGEMQVANGQQDYNPTKCNLNLCKGYQFADSTGAQLHKYTAGQVIPMTYEIHAPHTGVANVSVVDTATNKVIAGPMKSWDVYASNSATIPQDELTFSITMPDLGGKCTTPGECVIQHWWDAASINQTYESCLDFTMGGSGSGSGSGSSSPSSLPVSSAVAASSTAVAVSSAAPTTMQTSVRATRASSAVASATTAVSASATATPDDDDEDCEDDDEPATPSASATATPQSGSDDDEDCEDEE